MIKRIPWPVFVILFPLALALAFSVCGCTPNKPVAFTTACGMKILEPLPVQDVYDGGRPDVGADYLLRWWTPEEVQNVETLTLEAYAQTAEPFDPRFDPHAACKALDGVEVELKQEHFWFDASHGQDVMGLSHCYGTSGKWMELGRHTPNSGVLSHEMGHIIQDCHALGPTPHPGEDPTYDQDADPDHQNWGRFGVYEGIEKVQAIHWDEIEARDAVLLDGGAP